MRNDIEGVAFDLDGTLYPNYRFHLKLLPFLFKELRFISAFGRARNIIRKEQRSPSFVKGDFYQKQAEITANLLSVPVEPLKEKIDALIYRGWEPFFKTIVLFDGVQETLSALKKSGYKLALLSDFPPETKLEYLSLSGLWDAVLCSERCGALKPHPVSFTETAAALAISPEKILYVGNSFPYDVEGARGAGMKTAWIKSPLISGSRKKPPADFTFSNYRQLHDFMLN